ncbi:MAG TPA: proline iminopeptidase-family hydrolase [Streptosporangiaceae bacterium]|nr:proline iminopeptidase-family hydrolase [Streptosporangiaceae bacterium]
MSDELPAREGYLPFHGHRTWYRVTGDKEEPGKYPLLCLHGGPGATWHHMEPYQQLAADGRRVICYDQLGCGNSAVTGEHDPSMWTTELFLAEVAAVREHLGLDQCHVLGHSWGGMLGMAYAITRPAGLISLLVESSPPSVPFWLTELARLRADLPAGVDEVLRRHEDAGTTDSDEYNETMVAFYDRHVCRMRPYPDWLDRCFAGLNANPEVYFTMNGPSEFHVIGPLKDFDLTDDLGKIAVPTLLFCGEFDEVTPATVSQAHERIAGSQFVVMPGCSHMSQAERPDLALGLVRGWLAGAESAHGASRA